MVLGDHPGPDAGDGEAAEPGRDFELRGLRRQIRQEGEPVLLVVAHRCHEARAPAADRLEGDEVGEALDRLGDMGAEQAQGLARLAAELVDPPAHQDGREPGVEHERQQRQGDRPGDDRQA